MHLSELVFKKKKIFYFLLVAIVVGGIFSYTRLSKLEDPEIRAMVAHVITVYPGASAHEVELEVTNVLEDEIAAMADLNKLQSRSEANVSVVQVELKMTVPQKEISQRWEFLRRKIELAIPKLPAGAQKPMVVDDIGDVYGMFYAMVADDGFSYREMNDYANYIERNMLEVKGVKKVSVYGKQTPEILITLSADKMSEMGVMPMQIFSALSDHTQQLFAGNMCSGMHQLRVTVDEKARSVEDINDIIISSIGGASFKLGDIASIRKGCNEPLRNTLFVNNQRAVGIGMSMESGENIIEVGKRVEAKLAELRSQIPAGISFEKVFFQPDKVSAAIHSFMWNLVISVLIVTVVLVFTMGVKGGLIIGSGLIFTILATFPILLAVDGTLQRISLGAFIVAMGMLVDNAIVVLDGILIEKNKGKTSKSTYTQSAKQTAVPLLGATLIAMAAFFPVFLSQDAPGTYARDLFLVLAISLFISWILALTQIPLFAAALLKRNKKTNTGNSRVDNPYDRPFYKGIRRVLEYAMHHRFTTVAVFCVLLLLTVLSAGRVDNTFFPDFNYNQCYIEYTLPKGSSPKMVKAHLHEITNHFSTYDEVEMVVSSHGRTPMRYCLVRGMMTENADNYGELIVNFKDFETMQKMRPVLNDYLRTEFPEANSRFRNYTLSLLATHSIEVEFTGPDPQVLKNLSQQVQNLMLQNPHTDKYTICNDWEPQAQTLAAVYNPIAANRAAVSRSDVSNAILAATDGLPIATVYEGETAWPVRFRIRDKNGQRIEDLNDIPVWSTLPNIMAGINQNTTPALLTGATNQEELMRELLTAVPLSAVTNGIKTGWEEPVVRRLDGTRVIQAQCDHLTGISPAQVQNELEEFVSRIKLPPGYDYKWVGESEIKTEGLQGILGYAPIAAGIILLVLLLLFNGYRRPAIILLCLPMTIIGIIPGLLITGQPLSFIAIVGVMGLSGMIIKNAIVLLDAVERQLKQHTSRHLAVINATISRIRPVVMASLTTMLGMIPLLFDPMYGPMAVAIIAGLMVGTIITLIFVPILYSVFYNIRIH